MRKVRELTALREENAKLREALDEAGAIAMAQMIEHAGCTGDICVGRFNAAMDIYDAIASLAASSKTEEMKDD